MTFTSSSIEIEVLLNQELCNCERKDSFVQFYCLEEPKCGNQPFYCFQCMTADDTKHKHNPKSIGFLNGKISAGWNTLRSQVDSLSA